MGSIAASLVKPELACNRACVYTHTIVTGRSLGVISLQAKKKHLSAENLADDDSKGRNRPNRTSMPSFLTSEDNPPPRE